MNAPTRRGEKKPPLWLLPLLLALAGVSAAAWGLRPDRPVQIVAHRAGAALGPENTLAALERSIAAGADMAEVDVRRTRDGVLVVLHDSSLERTAGLAREVAQADYSAVRRLDAGGWFSPRFAGEEVPTLEAVLEAARGRIRLMVELKPDWGSGLAEDVVALIRAAGMEGQCVLASTQPALLRRCKELAPALETVYIALLLHPGLCPPDCADGYSVNVRYLTSAAVIQARTEGKALYAWTANSSQEIRRVLELGCDGVITDDPSLAARLLREGA